MSRKSRFDEEFQKKTSQTQSEKQNYFKKCRSMTGNYTFYDIERTQRLYAATFRLEIIFGKIGIATKVFLSSAYDHAIDMSLDRMKESQHWGERPERESYIEEKFKEYLLDKMRESNE
ncbi:hypothetical protein [Leptospira wolffii]|nr:hypothetical protein [Leptospira wolffii]